MPRSRPLYIVISIIAIAVLILSPTNTAQAAAIQNTQQPSSPKVAWAVIGTVIVGVATVVAALPVVAGAWESVSCSLKTQNVRSALYNETEYYSKRVEMSVRSYSFTAPSTTYYINRSSNLNNVLTSSLSNAIKAKTGVDVMGGRYTIGARNYTTNRSGGIVRVYAKYSVHKYSFDVVRSCWFRGDQMIASNAWFTAPKEVKGVVDYFKW